MSPLAIKIEESLTNLGTTEFESRHRILNRDGSIVAISLLCHFWLQQ
jgi:predicted DNA-binding ribbon-helix-helix protein